MMTEFKRTQRDYPLSSLATAGKRGTSTMKGVKKDRHIIMTFLLLLRVSGAASLGYARENCTIC